MKRTSRRFLILGILLFLALSGGLLRLVFPPYNNLLKELPEGSFTAGELFREFTHDPTDAFLRFADKVIILEGTVAATGDGFIILGQDINRVRCVLRHSIYDRKSRLKTGDRVTLKGICRGLNLTEVLVTQCIVMNKPSN